MQALGVCRGFACNPAHSTTKQGSRYGPLVRPSKPCKLWGSAEDLPATLLTLPPSKAVDMAHLCVPQNHASSGGLQRICLQPCSLLTTKQGSRYGPLACPSKPCKLCGVCRGFVPDIQVCGTLGREDLVNATITIERRRRTQSVVFAPGFLFRWPILLRIYTTCFRVVMSKNPIFFAVI